MAFNSNSSDEFSDNVEFNNIIDNCINYFERKDIDAQNRIIKYVADENKHPNLVKLLKQTKEILFNKRNNMITKCRFFFNHIENFKNEDSSADFGKIVEQWKYEFISKFEEISVLRTSNKKLEEERAELMTKLEASSEMKTKNEKLEEEKAELMSKLEASSETKARNEKLEKERAELMLKLEGYQDISKENEKLKRDNAESEEKLVNSNMSMCDCATERDKNKTLNQANQTLLNEVRELTGRLKRYEPNYTIGSDSDQ